MRPVSWLPLRSNRVSLERLPSCGGMRPVKRSVAVEVQPTSARRDCPVQPGSCPSGWLEWSHKDGQIGEIAQFSRDRTPQDVAVEGQLSQIGEIAQFSRDRTRQVVAVEPQDGQIGEIAQFSRDLPRQLVAVEGQRLQIGEGTQRSRDAAI